MRSDFAPSIALCAVFDNFFPCVRRECTFSLLLDSLKTAYIVSAQQPSVSSGTSTQSKTTKESKMTYVGFWRFYSLMLFFSSTGRTWAFLAWPMATQNSVKHSKGCPLFGKGFLEQNPGESDIQFFKRIQSAASDSATFERMVLGKDDGDKKEAETATNSESRNKSTSTGYQRVEDWDAEIKARQKKGEYTWEERVQFEGQKYGDAVNQNEILRKNLKVF
jgi:hypothetical protein